MISVKVGELRNKLSSYLKRVRRGAEVVITDRETPIGKIIPYTSPTEEKFEIIPPAKGYEGFSKLDFPDMDIDFDPVEILLEDRRKR